MKSIILLEMWTTVMKMKDNATTTTVMETHEEYYLDEITSYHTEFPLEVNCIKIHSLTDLCKHQHQIDFCLLYHLLFKFKKVIYIKIKCIV